MTRRAILIYVVSAIIIGIIGVLTVYFTLIATGAIDTQSHKIVFASGNAEKTYDGKPLSCSDWTITEGELEKGHEAVVTFSGQLTESGSVANDFSVTIIDEAGADVTERYSMKLSAGVLTVAKREIGIIAGNAEKIYDGTPLTSHEYEMFSGELLGGHRLEASFMGQRTDAGLGENVVSVHVFDEKENDVTHNYEVISHTGQLEVLPRPVKIQTENFSRPYDATPLKSFGGEVVGDPLIAGHSLETTSASSITRVGTTKNAVSVTIEDENGRDVTHNYAPEYITGTLEVTPLAITVFGKRETYQYDGTEKYLGVLVAEIPDSDYQPWYVTSDTQAKFSSLGDEISTVEIEGGGIDQGEYIATLGAIEILNERGEDVTDCYEIEKIDGVVTIKQRLLVLQAGSARSEYNSANPTELICTDYEVIGDDVLAIHRIDRVVNEGSQTVPGESVNKIKKAIIKDNVTGAIVTDNYDITFVNGKLVVLEEGSLPALDDKIVDDEEEQPPAPPNDVPLLTITGDGTSEQTVYLKRTAEVKYELGEGELYGDHFSDGKNNNQYIYNGTLPGTNLNMNYLSSVSVKNIDMPLRTVTIMREVKDGTQSTSVLAVQPEYSLAKNDVKYTTTDGDIRYTYQSTLYSMQYYDFDYLKSGYLFADGVFYAGEYTEEESAYRQHVYTTYLQMPDSTKEYFVEYLNKLDDATRIKSATKYMQIVEIASRVSSSNQYNKNYKPSLDSTNDVAVEFFTSGSLYNGGVCRHYAQTATMLFRALGIPARYVEGFVVKLTSDNDYEETLTTQKGGHAWVEVYLDGIGWVNVEVTGTDVYSSKDSKYVGMPKSVRRPGGEKDEIKASEIQATYDSRNPETRLDGWGLTELCLQEGLYYTATASMHGKRVGWGITQIFVDEFRMFYKNTNQELTKQEIAELDIDIRNGEAQVYAQEIIVTTPDKSKQYDGSALICGENDLDDVIITFGKACEDGFNGVKMNSNHEVKVIEFSNKPITEVGSIDNIAKVIVRDSSGSNVTSYYYIRENRGTLTISPRVITIATRSSTRVTDVFEPDYSKPLTANGYKVKAGVVDVNNFEITEGMKYVAPNALAPGHEIELIVTGKIVGYDGVSNTFELISIKFNATGEDCKDNYKINSDLGELLQEWK